MSAPDDTKGAPPEEPVQPAPEEEAMPDDAPDSGRLRDLLKRASQVPPPAPKKDVLHGVQRRIRQRSRGKFYADGWSTREENPRSTYLVTAVVMLVLLGIVYFVLVPGGIGRLLPSTQEVSTASGR